jgi:hypothetical protein
MPLYSATCPLPKNQMLRRHQSEASPIPTTDLSLWLKADAGVATIQSTYVSQIILSCTGGLSSYSGTYIATSIPDVYGVYSLFCSANSKTISKEGEESDFAIGPDFTLASSGNGINWSLQNVLVVGMTISGATGSYTDANGSYGLNERTQGNANLVNANGYNLNTNTSGVCEIYSPNSVFFLYSNSSNGSGAWTNESGTGTVTASSITLDPSGTASGSITTSYYGGLNVSDWADQSGNGNNAAARNGNVTFVSSVINGSPVLRFDGASNLITNNFFVNNYNTPITIIAVSKASASTVRGEQPTARYIVGVTNNGGYEFGLAYGAYETASPNFSNCYGITYVSGADIESSAMGENEKRIASTINSGSQISFFLDGTLIGTADPANQSGGSNSTGAFSIGSDVVLDEIDNFFCTCDIAEIVIYNRAITTPERQQIEAYLNTKYAIY